MSTRGWRTRTAAAALAVAAGLPAVGTTTGPASAAAPPPTLGVRGSVDQLFVIGAPTAAAVVLRDRRGRTVQTGTTDSLGGLVFRNVAPGAGYTATVTAGGAAATSAPTTVLDDGSPPESFYTSQAPLPTGTPPDPPDSLAGTPGYGYLVTRDGTTLSATIELPGPADRGPYPVLVEYSGYAPSEPSLFNFNDNPSPFPIFARLLGYAYVGVNIRGTGCSGGAFDFFENLQSLDGYDVIETVAAQPWAGRVGMVGVSYPGISQLFVARTRPPHLSAISPLSVIDDTFRGTLYPGGIANNGFARSWAQARVDQNRWPDPKGADWVVRRIGGGDTTCLDNMGLRQQNADLLGQIEQNPFYPPVGDPDYPQGGNSLAPWSFAHEIDVPTFLAGAWQDEETGGHWADMIRDFTSVPPHALRVTAQNGVHPDSLDPRVIVDLIDFLALYVRHEAPRIPPAAAAFVPALYQQAFGISGIVLPHDPLAGYSSYAAARTAYEAMPPVRVLWENGAGDATHPGVPEPTAETRYASWPVPGTTATPWYLQPDGKLAPTPPVIPDDVPRGADSYVSDPTARPRADLPGGSAWGANPAYDWTPLVDGKALSFVSTPLPRAVTMLGPGSVDLWLRSSAPDTDLQVTLSEVYPDGSERYVQSGWLRASQRRLDTARSSVLLAIPTQLRADAAPLSAGRFSLVRVGLFPFGHVFHAGSRLRVGVEAPGGDRPLWEFATLPGTQTNTIAHSVGRASRIVLPVVPDAPVPTDPPPCPSLRAQPCRVYLAPGAPTDAVAVLHHRRARVSWDPAPVPPGETLTGYTVIADHGPAPQTVDAGTRAARFGDLVRGATYSFAVIARYAAGQSPPSTPSNTVTVATVGHHHGPRIVTGPPRSTRSHTATFAFVTHDGDGRTVCSLDLGRFRRCSSPVTYRHLRPGRHVFVVAARDPADPAGGTDARVWSVAGDARPVGRGA